MSPGPQTTAFRRAASRNHCALSLGIRSHRRAEMSARWVYVHMIEEYARHNGHADLLRECIDGATGL
jgi:hypothetical protein